MGIRASSSGPNAQAKKGQQVGVGEIDAIIESVHLLSSGLEAMTLAREVQVIEGMRHRPIPEGSTFGAELVKAIYEYAAGAGIPLPPPDPVALARWGGMFFMFPNYFVLPQYGNALVYRVRPNGDDPESCVFELWSLTIPARGRAGMARPVVEGPYAPDDTDHWPRIPLQDFSNIGRQQRGIHSPGLRRDCASPIPTRRASAPCTASSTATWRSSRDDRRPAGPHRPAGGRPTSSWWAPAPRH